MVQKPEARQGKKEPYAKQQIQPAAYRPFVSCYLYDSALLIDERGSASELFPHGQENRVMVLTGANSQKPFMAHIVTQFWICIMSARLQQPLLLPNGFTQRMALVRTT